MNTEHLTNILPDHVALISYIKDGVHCSKYFALLSGGKQSAGDGITLHNLVTEEPETINLAQNLSVIQDSLSGNSFLCKSFIKSKERVNSFKSFAEQISLNQTPVFAKLTNQATLVFENQIPFDVFLSFLKTKIILSQPSSELLHIIANSPNGDLTHFVLSCLFNITNLTVDSYKRCYKLLVEAYVNKELKQLATEWPVLTKTFPELNKNEVLFATKYLEKTTKDSINKINKIKEHQIKEHWSKLIKISYHCWPKPLQPNPFTELLNL